MRLPQVVLACWVAGAVLGLAAGVDAQEDAQETPPPRPSLIPEQFDLSEAARKAIDATWLTENERKDLRVFHGDWTDADLDSPARQAQASLNAWDFDNPALADETVPAEVRAEALIRQGEMQAALTLLAGVDSFRAARLRAEAFELLGEFEKADQAVDPVVQLLVGRRLEDAAALNEGVKALIVRSRVRGQPARDFQTMIDLLAMAREQYDRLHWPVMLTEAELLLEKDNMVEALGALEDVLTLNPRCAEAWHGLGRVALSRFDFEGAGVAASALRGLNPDHPLAALLLAESSMVQNDPAMALDQLRGVVERHPNMRTARALQCAAVALTYDEENLVRMLAAFDQLSPRSALAHYEVGRFLSFDRQYDAAAVALNEAVKRQPNWPAPRIELAMLELQSGRDALALEALRGVRELDQHNKRVANSLHLLEELMSNFNQIETEHFVIRYSPETEDLVFVEMMPETLERIHATVAGRFGHEPDRRTVIEVMPDHQWLGVRIGGMPFIHTIAACTGPVIAMEVPREGARQKHLGPFDWPRVLQHEYTHTITLSQTRNRIPHWLTEAAAVSMEQRPRGGDTIMLLVSAFESGELFDLDEINWAFIRPKKPTDRGLAYAQGHWMVEFMNERFGESALVRLLERYFEGEREEEALPAALGISREQFYSDFLAWAGERVASWGFAPTPAMPEILREAGISEESIESKRWILEVTDEQVATWLEKHPDHPDVLKTAIDRTLARLEKPDLMLAPLIEKYVAARPVDPNPHRLLARIWQDTDTPQRAIPHLEELDLREEYDNVYAIALANLHREQGDKAKAMEKITRAVNINPYKATIREMAAAIAVEAGDLAAARRHIFALTILEPGRPQHQKRLEALDRLIADSGG